MSVRAYRWYLAAFGALVGSGIAIGIAGATFLESKTPLYASLVLSIVAMALAVVAWLRFPKGER